MEKQAGLVPGDESADAGSAYGLGSFPYLVITDAGNVVYRHSGELGDDGIVSTLQRFATR